MNNTNFNNLKFNNNKNSNPNQQNFGRNKRKRNKGRGRFNNNDPNKQNNCFFKDDLDGYNSFNSFNDDTKNRSGNHYQNKNQFEYNLDDLMNKMKERRIVNFDFLKKLVSSFKLNYDLFDFIF